MVREHRQNNIENIFNGTDRNRHQIRLIFTPFNHYIVFSLKFIDDDCKRQSNWELQSLKLKWHILWIHGNARIGTSSSLKGPGKIVAFTTLLIQVACRYKALAVSDRSSEFKNSVRHRMFQRILRRQFRLKRFYYKARVVYVRMAILSLAIPLNTSRSAQTQMLHIFRLYILGACSDEHMQLHLEHTHACDVGLPLYENGKINEAWSDSKE
uniref:Uncharacterized protein n=1 Tax=Onchocerca volvulus TaxID=6282 RepID=A0A8R1TJE4_ONCVO